MFHTQLVSPPGATSMVTVLSSPLRLNETVCEPGTSQTPSGDVPDGTPSTVTLAPPGFEEMLT